jgi:drug/metabolite transporter (DMT)-like permease
MAIRGKPAAATLGLLAVTAVWGSTFLIVQDAVARMPVFGFLSWRFGVAALALIAFRPRAPRRLSRLDIRHGILLGLVLGSAYITQTIGLRSTPAAISGFITGLFVVLAPLLSWVLLRRRQTAVVWLGVLLATAGLALITLSGATFGLGELATLACAVFFGLHIAGLGEWSAGRDGYALTTVQIATVATVCLAVSAAQGPVLPHGSGEWEAIAITGIAASAVAYLVQTWAQSLLSAVQTSVVLTMEPVFAGLFAVAVGKQPLHATTIAGGALVVTAMYLIELRGTRPGPPAHDDPEPSRQGTYAGTRDS